MDLSQIKQKLENYGQTHLLQYYDSLTVQEQKNLCRQIESIDFSLLELCKEGVKEAEKGRIAPIDALTLEEIEKNKDTYYEAGVKLLRQGKVGAVLLAGGQGTRLGFDKPKGTFRIGVNRDLYIFQCLIQNLMDVTKQINLWVPLMIMTSDKNHTDTVEFFQKHDFFGYPKEYVFFFQQEMAPSVDYQGKILMERKDALSMSPNGNGGWFSSLMNSGVLAQVKKMGVEWLNIFSVDNVLQKIADPCFIGATLLSGNAGGSKVVAKAFPQERVGVMCLEDGKPSIVEYYELSEQMRYEKKKNGEYAYHYGVILNYLFKIADLEKILKDKMPLHIVEKKIPFLDEKGKLVKPEEPNGYKFETLILDMIHMLDNCLAYEVEREKEFAPVKNKEGVDSVDTARELLKKNGIEI